MVAEASEPLLLTFRHWAGVSPYTSPFGFAETCVFDKQSPGPLYCGPQGLHRPAVTPHGHPFSQSYRAKLSNSLTRVRSNASGLLPQSTSVGLRYGRRDLLQRGFSWRHRFNRIPQGCGPRVFDPLGSWRWSGFAYPSMAYGAKRAVSSGAPRLPFRVPPLLCNEKSAVQES